MVNEVLTPAEGSLGKLPNGDRNKPHLLEDPADAVRQRFLDEVIGRPMSGPAEKLQVIKRDENEKPPEKKKTPAELAQAFEAKAHEQLDRAHAKLNFTNDRFEPRV